MTEKKYTVTSYVAFDGKEFDSRTECEIHEAREKMLRSRKERLEKLDELEIDYIGMPLLQEEFMENHSYYWYKLNSIEDAELLISVATDFDMAFENKLKGLNYPCIICVEDFSYKEKFEEDCWVYTLDECIENAKEFFKAFGYEVTLKKVKEI